MGRKRELDFLDEVHERLKTAPVWVGPVLAGFPFVVCRFLLPLFIPAPQAGVDAGVFLRGHGR